jgi:ABC-type phosphate/phosphonate transport system substrate-binding protein
VHRRVVFDRLRDVLSSVRRSPFRVATPLVVGAAVLAGVLVAGPGGAPTSSATAADRPSPVRRLTQGCRDSAVRFGIVLPAGDKAGLRAATAVTDEIGEQIGCRAIVVTRGTQPQLLAALALHQVDFAQVDPATLVAGERTVALTVMGAYSAAADTPARVATAPRLWARRGGPVSALKDARDRRIVLGPELTVAGDLAPRSALLAAGVPTAPAIPAASDTATAVTRAEDDGDALGRLRAGDADLALTHGAVTPAQSRGLRAVWTGEAPLADVLVIRPGVPNEVRRLLLSAVRDVPGALLAPLAERQGITHPIPLLPVPAELYDAASDQFDALTSAGLAP